MAGQAPQSLWKKLDDAARRIEDNDYDAAKQLVQDALLAADYDPIFYSDAISTLMLARLYADAARVHTAYTEGTGKRLRADFSLEEIREERAAAEPHRDADGVTYRRLTVIQRGHFSNYFTLFPVTQIRLAADGITLWKRSREWRLPWSSVRVTIRRRLATKGFGRSSFARYTQRLCSIEADGLHFRFDLSDQYPDFGAPTEIIAVLEQHTPVVWT